MAQTLIHRRVRNDRAPSLTIDAVDLDGTAIDLTTATTPTFTMVPQAGGTAKVAAAVATIVDAAAGRIRYTFAAADVDTAGTFVAEFQVLLGGTLPLTIPGDDTELLVVIRADRD